MTSEAVFIQVGALADGFARTATCWPPPVCPQANALPLC